MKRTVLITLIIFCLLVLGGCGLLPNNQPMQLRAPTFDHTPIASIDDKIIASGYMFISDSRYSSGAPSISFHPYPGYFHLFPFAMWNGIPHFTVKNTVDEIFDLLGKERDSILADRFGNQQLDSVTVVFDNFTQRDFGSGHVFVYADAMSFIEDWTGDDWEIVQPDFIIVTNGDRTIEPIQMQVGDTFMGLTLMRIESSQAFLRNAETYYQLSAEGEFSGQVELKGDLIIGLYFDSDYRVRVNFSVESDHLRLLPRIDDFGESNPIVISNTDVVMSAFGITRSELDAARSIEITGVTVIIEIVWVSSFGYIADFVELRAL
jgi:hypothetical protein